MMKNGVRLKTRSGGGGCRGLVKEIWRSDAKPFSYTEWLERIDTTSELW
jgi:hypothetical protein